MKKALSIALLSCVAVTANAKSLTSTDLFTSGDGLLTFDQSTGMEWLDVSATKGYTVAEILAGQGGWIEAGFRYATDYDLRALYVDGGLTALGSYTPETAPWDSFTSLDATGPQMVDMLGPTDVHASGWRRVEGFTDPHPCWSAIVCEEEAPFFTEYRSLTIPAPGQIRGTLASDSSADWVEYDRGASPTRGSWLLRQSSTGVPEPRMLFLLAAGGIAFALTRRRPAKPSLGSACVPV
jgi:hypothetical protein